MAPAQTKRRRQVVDLTGDDDDQPQSKYSRGNGHDNRRQPNAGTSTTLESSRLSLPGSSQQQPTSTAALDGQEFELVDQNQNVNSRPFELYGSMDTKIVGVRYYNGVATVGEYVVCSREPSNPYDQNAVRINNVLGQQIGHIGRKVAEKLAPYVDGGDIVLEGILTGEKGSFDCPMRLYLYGPSEPWRRPDLEEKLKADKLLKANQLKATKKEAEARRKTLGLKSGTSSTGLSSSQRYEQEVSLQELMANSEARDFRGPDDFAKTLAMDEDSLAALPMAAPPSALESQLLPYQLQGLAWLTSQENPKLPVPSSKEAVQLWQRDSRGRFLNVATNFTISTPPTLVSGGILADDMGLGKTLQVISLILESGFNDGPTLIVAPVSVMSNWEQQIRLHVQKQCLPSMLLYHNRKTMSKPELSAYQVVITSYGKLSSEYKPGHSDGLYSLDWRRVVLDEGHTIRNPKTRGAQAATALRAQSRWVLTGTPIVNGVRDFQSLLQFLKITGGVEQADVFNSVIARPLMYGDPTAEALMQSLMQDLCLRRKKDMKFVDLKLPAKTEYIHRIDFRPDEKVKYDAMMSEAQGALEEYQRGSNTGHNGRYRNVLERLLRLRQICCHWTLCKERVVDLLAFLEDKKIVELNSKNVSILQQALQLTIDSQEECAICFEDIGLHEPVITACKHVFGRPCISKTIELQGKCPMCRAALTMDSLVNPAPEASEDEQAFDAETQGSKTEALTKILRGTLKDPLSKVVVFSQWTSFLNIVQQQLDDAGLKYTRIDGSMAAPKRDQAIDALYNDHETRILLASLSVCSVGLNLVAADTVILMDSWWAPAIEDQAVDRVHRLGQKRPTTVWRLVVGGTVEERVLDIQAEKRRLVGVAFQEKDKRGKQAKETRMADIAKLLA